jgi:hypothetical protein
MADTMSHPFARPLPRIDEQLTTLVTLQADTRHQLEQVRREITRLHAHELTLVGTYGQREARIDGLLDERLTAAGV